MLSDAVRAPSAPRRSAAARIPSAAGSVAPPMWPGSSDRGGSGADPAARIEAGGSLGRAISLKPEAGAGAQWCWREPR